MITGENIGDEGLWKSDLWRTPVIQVWTKLLFKFEDCTEVTTRGKTQTFYDGDTKLATMTLSNIIKNFKDVSTFMNLFQSSVRQSMIKRLVSNGVDKDV